MRKTLFCLTFPAFGCVLIMADVVVILGEWVGDRLYAWERWCFPGEPE